MNRQPGRIAFGLTLLLTLGFHTILGQQGAMEAPKVPRKSIAFVPYYHPRTGCHPVEVKFVSLGGQPLDVFLLYVSEINFSDGTKWEGKLK